MSHKVFLLGDSTCANKRSEVYPETGWGMCFYSYLKQGWIVDNRAVNGMSSKSALANGVFDALLKDVSPDDYVIIQFGHNEDKPDEERHTEPWSTYMDNLAYMATKLQEKQAHVIFISSIERRRFENGREQDSLHDYPVAMEQCAKDLSIPFIDMTRPTLELIQTLGFEGSRQLFMNLDLHIWPNFPEGLEDNTHLSHFGAQTIAKMIAQKLKNFPFIC
ncbi:MAG: rhamnogalacturonan acetylesterase [Sphaerochaetaceae bacterium]